MISLLLSLSLADWSPCLPDFSAVFSKAQPSVVIIVAGRKVKESFHPERTGAGFVWDQEGHILTQEHLVGDAPILRVRSADGRLFPATLVGRDAPTDLAVLHISEAKLSPLPQAQEPTLKPGQWVAALGHPHGLEFSISVGIISGLNRRELPIGGPRYANFIQTNLNMNPGNSGGPLVDAQGLLIGMNTAILGGAQGLSFATPLEMLKLVSAQLIKEGCFQRGFAGLFIKEVSLRSAKAAGLSRPQGARVKGLVAGGAAQRAGLKLGDIILNYDDREILSSTLLPWLIATTPPGTSASLKIARGSDRLSLQMILETAP